MTTYSAAGAKNHLPPLIDRALDGNAVVITRHGTPVVELRAIPASPTSLRQPGSSGTAMATFDTRMADSAAVLGPPVAPA